MDIECEIKGVRSCLCLCVVCIVYCSFGMYLWDHCVVDVFTLPLQFSHSSTFARTANRIFPFVVNCHRLKCDFSLSLGVCLSFQFVLYCVTALSCYVNVSDKLISFPRSIHLIIFLSLSLSLLLLNTTHIWMHIYERFMRWLGFYYYFIGVLQVSVWVITWAVILVLYSFANRSILFICANKTIHFNKSIVD